MKIAIITAMQSEYDAVYKLYDFKDTSGIIKSSIAKVGDKELLLIKSGMGKVNAAVATQIACQKGANLVINTGLAGGIDMSLNQGDIVLADKVCYHDVWCGEPNAYGQVQDMPLYYNMSEELVKKICQANPEFNVGLIVTGDHFLTDVNRLLEIKKIFSQGLATDMESAAVAQTCFLNHIDCISLRIISDVVGKEGQDEQYNNFWKNVPHKASEMIVNTLKAI